MLILVRDALILLSKTETERLIRQLLQVLHATT